MPLFEYILVFFLIVCAVAAVLARRLIISVLIFATYGLIMSLIWLMLQAPDLAITEAAVGVGATSILFFLVLKNTHSLKGIENDDRD